jgi:hypothetical protein
MEHIARMETLLRRGGREFPSRLSTLDARDGQPSYSEREYGPAQGDDGDCGVAENSNDNVLEARQQRTPSFSEAARDVASIGDHAASQQESANEVCDFLAFDVPQYPISPPSTTAHRISNEEAPIHGCGESSASTRHSIDVGSSTYDNNCGVGKSGNNNEPLTPVTLATENVSSPIRS